MESHAFAIGKYLSCNTGQGSLIHTRRNINIHPATRMVHLSILPQTNFAHPLQALKTISEHRLGFVLFTLNFCIAAISANILQHVVPYIFGSHPQTRTPFVRHNISTYLAAQTKLHAHSVDSQNSHSTFAISPSILQHGSLHTPNADTTKLLYLLPVRVHHALTSLNIIISTQRRHKS